MDSTSLYLCLDHAEYDDDGYKGKKYHPMAHIEKFIGSTGG